MNDTEQDAGSKQDENDGQNAHADEQDGHELLKEK